MRDISIGKISFFNVLATVLIFSCAIGVFAVWSASQNYERRVERLKERYFADNRELVKNETRKVVERIEYTRKSVYERLQSNLAEKTDYVAALFSKELSKNGSLGAKELTAKFADEIAAFKWNNDTGYVYILDSNANVIYHKNSALIGQNLFVLAKNNDEVVSFIKNASKIGELYGRYKWTKPGFGSKLFDKYVYVKKFEPLNIYIAAGFYVDEVDKDIQKIVLAQLRHERFGHDGYGYFWVHDLSMRMLEHPINKSLVGQSVAHLKTKDGSYLFAMMNEIATKEGEGYISYEWDRPDGKGLDKKTSYISLVKDWDWVVGSGFYTSELESMLALEKKEAWRAAKETALKTLFVLSLLAALSVAVARAISKKISAIEKSQKLYSLWLEQYKNILDETAVVSKTDVNGYIHYVNDKFCKVSGFSREEALGKKHNIVSHPQTSKDTFRTMWKTIIGGDVWRGVVKNRTKSGRSYYNDTTIMPIKDETGAIVEYISSGVDLTELFDNKERLVNSFQTDAVTGLGSRIKLLSCIKEDQKTSLALIDISRFSEVNDLKGHAFGDKIIVECAKRLFDGFAQYGANIFRVHADVFAILSNEKTDKELEETILRFIEEEGKKPYVVEGEIIPITYNVGIAQGYGEVLAWSEIALQHAKDSKESHVAIFSFNEKSIERFKENIEWTARIGRAIENDGVAAYFQPIYNYETQKTEKYETLMRIVEDGVVYSPFKFLDIAKKTKLYPKLTYIMIEKSVEAFADKECEFSINLTIDDLLNQGLTSYLLERSRLKGVAGRMVIEIVESEEMQNYEELLNVIKALKNAGIKIAIDDFGSGYSNYEYLSSLEADYVKIDGSLIKAMRNDERAYGVVSSIVEFAKKYNMKTIAEFVSDEELDESVRNLGVDYAQGYFYGEPRPFLAL